MKFATVFLPILTLASGFASAIPHPGEAAAVLQVREDTNGTTNGTSTTTAIPTTTVTSTRTTTTTVTSTPTPIFKLKNFYNYGRPHSAVAYLNFELETPTGAKANCTATKTDKLATAALYTRCSKLGVGFGFSRVGAGYFLTVVHRYNRDKNIDSAVLFIPDDHVKRSTNANPNAQFYYIDYPTSFNLRSNNFVVNGLHGPTRT
ncbi:hypothetical protein TWF481_000258 [Arthrobotrys musiformis]|uniref:Uncharacterized protein n=1 Tax=Arthrobotrys musiformis TaxID=47236 RepID=A0AAV9WM47_9PEZI